MKIKDILFTIIIILLTFLSFIYSKYISNSFYECFIFTIKIILPSLFPFMIFVNFILLSNCINYLATFFSKIGKLLKVSGYGILIIIASIIGGYPYSSILISSFVKENKISTQEANKLIPFCFFPSISFIFSGLININPFYSKYVFLIIISIYISSFMFILFKKNNNIENKKIKLNENNDYISIFFNVMNSTIKSIFTISFCIIFFSILKSFLSLYLKNYYILTILSGILEFSSTSINILMKPNNTLFDFILLNFIISFSSFSIIFQSIYYLKEIGYKIKKLIIYRLLVSLFSILIFIILFYLF